mgnify:CR=1 FL=1
MKLSSLSKTSLLLVVCFAADKVLAILRQLIIAWQFGLSDELDIFNIANNLPDMLFILISGGAMAMVVIPVLTDVIEKKTIADSWRVFSTILNLTFAASFFLAALIWIFAEPIVTSEFGIAPGFGPAARTSVIRLMRLNLISTLIFSVSGLFMGALQANRRFLLPAVAPLFYNLGQIFGAVVLAPEAGFSLGSASLPALGLGIDGLAYGVIIGAVMYSLIQLPGLLRLGFRWSPRFELRDENVRRMLRIFVPRVLTVFFVQLIFIFRDNFASRLQPGAVSALSYSYMFQQLPETLIGTALGTALLPSLSLFISERDAERFAAAFSKTVRLIIALTFGIAVIMSVGLAPVVAFALKLDGETTGMFMWTLTGFLAGLTGHCLLEVANRSFYAQQDAASPFFATVLNFGLFIALGYLLSRTIGVAGISFSDSLAFTVQALVLIIWLRVDPSERNRRLVRLNPFRALNHGGADGVGAVSVRVERPGGTILRSALGALVTGALLWVFMSHGGTVLSGLSLSGEMLNLVKSILGMAGALVVYTFFILPELRFLKTL